MVAGVNILNFSPASLYILQGVFFTVRYRQTFEEFADFCAGSIDLWSKISSGLGPLPIQQVFDDNLGKLSYDQMGREIITL